VLAARLHACKLQWPVNLGNGMQEEFPVPLDESYTDEVHAWLELNEDEVRAQ
jgi:hypothetical protein